mgnify:CR=1 FL=1
MRGWLIIILCLAFTPVRGAVVGNVRVSPSMIGPDEKLYIAAVRCFQAGHWDTANRWLSELIQRHPNSPRRSLAVLLKGQALFQQEKYKETYAALSNDRLAAGPLADEYLFWMAECRSAQGNLEAASQIYQELLREHAQSERALGAIVALADVAARQEDWLQVVEYLRPVDGVFQLQAAENAAMDQVVEGRLLLAQALVEQNDPESAAGVLNQLPVALIKEQDWRRRLLQAKIAIKENRLNDALVLGDGLRVLADREGWVGQLLAAYQLRADIFERQSDAEMAVRELEHLMAANLPVSVRKHAFLNMARLTMGQRDFTGAIRVLEALQSQEDLKGLHAVADCLLGEAHLAMHRLGERGHLKLALAHLQNAVNSGRADIVVRSNWGMARYQLAAQDFDGADEWIHKALEAGAESELQPWLQYELAMNQLRQDQLAEAFAGFQNVRTNALNGVPTDLIHAARFMQFQSALKSNNQPGAEVLLAEMRRQDGASYLGHALLAMARDHIGRDAAESAEAMLVEFRQAAPGPDLQAAAALEEIRLMLRKPEPNWTVIVASFRQWLKDYPAHALRHRVAYDLAWALAQSGQIAEGEQAFKRLIESAPKSREAYMARLWQADRFFNSNKKFGEAELAYKQVRGDTNCPIALRERAGMMAGRAAMRRQGFDDARTEFSALIDNALVSNRTRMEASFALGDLTMLELSGIGQGRIEKLTQSTNAFYSITQLSPTNAVAARAWGRIGDICLMVSGDTPGYQTHARVAYQKSLEVTGSVPVAVRSQAHIGMAYTLERQKVAGEERAALLEEAVGHLQSVFYGRHLDPGQKQDPYWRGQSGLAALRLLEQLGKFDEALKMCQEMEHSFPGMREGLRVRRARLNRLLDKQP